MVQAAVLSEPTDDVVRLMVDDFKQRHRAGNVDPSPLKVFLKYAHKLGGNYNRFSCDNSSPLSIIDQLVNALDKARSENRFVPWVYVFADYSVTGLDASRQGYSSYKAILADEQQLIDTTYIDDFTRAGRNEIEVVAAGCLVEAVQEAVDWGIGRLRLEQRFEHDLDDGV